jgi:adenylate kinase family enzyme
VTSKLGIVLLGPPGIGKGTQGARLRTEFDLARIASDDLLRAGETLPRT